MTTTTTKTTTWITLIWEVIQSLSGETFTKKELLEKGLETFQTHYPNNKNIPTSVGTNLTKLVKEGKLERVAKGVYKISETHKEDEGVDQLALF